MLEEIAADDQVKATQRLRALEELGRMDARENGAASDEPVDEMAPDPMADLDELEAVRRKRRKAA